MTYKDINPKYTESELVDEKAINESILNIVFTRRGELPGLPEFGSNIQDMVFDIADNELEISLENELEYVLERWETRIVIININVEIDYDYNRIIVTIEYKINKELKDSYSSKFITFKVER